MLDIQDLRVHFRNAPEGKDAVKGISLHMDQGEILGLVGESGSGKTVTAMALAGLLSSTRTQLSGRIVFRDRDLFQASREELRAIRGKEICVVFQEPMTSLDPVMPIGPQVEEALLVHTGLPPDQRRVKALQAMADAELPDPETLYRKYPHELSGGMLQRVMIAAAIISEPDLLICDEPTTALDVTIQEGILTLLKKINQEKGTGILFISHNLHVVRKLCTRVAVMCKGELIEEGPVDQVFFHPQQDYTTALDVTIQEGILTLLKKINQEKGTGILFISHNLHVVRKLCTRVAVMCKGELIEEGPVDQVFFHPQQDYTKRLIAAIPTRRKRG